MRRQDGFYLHNFVDFLGMPCWNPPYGTLSAYDLNDGKLLWKKPFGEVQKWGFYMPEWGSVTIGAPPVTKSGLIFIGASLLAETPSSRHRHPTRSPLSR